MKAEKATFFSFFSRARFSFKASQSLVYPRVDLNLTMSDTAVEALSFTSVGTGGRSRGGVSPALFVFSALSPFAPSQGTPHLQWCRRFLSQSKRLPVVLHAGSGTTFVDLALCVKAPLVAEVELV